MFHFDEKNVRCMTNTFGIMEAVLPDKLRPALSTSIGLCVGDELAEQSQNKAKFIALCLNGKGRWETIVAALFHAVCQQTQFSIHALAIAATAKEVTSSSPAYSLLSVQLVVHSKKCALQKLLYYYLKLYNKAPFALLHSNAVLYAMYFSRNQLGKRGLSHTRCYDAVPITRHL